MSFVDRNRWRLVRWGVLALALSAGTTAAAHEPGPFTVPGSFYLGGGVGAEYVNLEEVEVFATAQASALGPFDAFGSTDGSFWSESAHLFVGFADPEGLTLPDPIGQNARIELRGRFTRGDSDETATEVPLRTIAMADISDPMGSGTGGVSFFPGSRPFGDAAHETRLRTWQGDLLYRTDVHFGGVVGFSPLVGLTYTRFELDNAYWAVIPGLVGTFGAADDLDGFFDLQDEIEADYYGIALGGDLRLRPASFLELRLGGRADLMGAEADLDARQNLRLFSGTTPSESDEDSSFAARLTGSLGASLWMGPVELALDAFATWLSYAPSPDHPQVPTALTPVTDGPSHIDDEDLWSAGWQASLTIWF